MKRKSTIKLTKMKKEIIKSRIQYYKKNNEKM